MAKDRKKLAGQNPEHILKSLENIIETEGEMAPLHMKNHLASTFFRMIMNEEEIDDRLRNTARSYLQLFEFLSTFDEQIVDFNK